MKIRGPLRQNAHDEQAIWTADVDIVTIHQPSDQLALRALFIAPTNNGPGAAPSLAPGTVLAQCTFNKVKVNLGDKSYEWDVDWPEPTALLLLQFPPQEWQKDLVDANVDIPAHSGVCIAGEFKLNLQDRNANNEWRDHFRTILDQPDALIIHSSGLSLIGRAIMPWQPGSPMAAPASWHVMMPFVSGVNPSEDLYIELDRDRLDAAGSSALLKSFANLNSALNPDLKTIHPALKTGSVWTTLELPSQTIQGQERIPAFSWTLTPIRNGVGPSATFVFGPGEVTLLLADETGSSASSMPDVTFPPPSGDGLAHLVINAFDPNTPAGGVYSFTAGVETFKFQGLQTAYNPTDVAAFVRGVYTIDEPLDEPPAAVVPQVLWGFVPLEEGWAQLPFFNVSPAIYNSTFPEFGAVAARSATSLAGVVSWGNDDNPSPGEQPWSLTLLGAQTVTGLWKLDAGITSVQSVDLRLINPSVELDGFFWLATETPSAADALPSLDNWLRGVRMIALRTVDLTDPQPSPHIASLSDLEFHRQAGASPVLTTWNFELDANENQFAGQAQTVWDRMLTRFPDIAKPDMPAPLVWSKHLTLPAVHLLPLTQRLDPPAYPSPSRQLTPFALSTNNGKPDGWKFGAADAASAAKKWASFSSRTMQAYCLAGNPQGDGASCAPFRLSSLSVPGLVFYPAGGFINGTSFGARYRHGLPYLDETNALSQVAKATPQNGTTPPATPALTREDYAAYWSELVTKAALAAAQNDEATIVTAAGTVAIQGLAEPSLWPVGVMYDDLKYPGSLTFTDAHAGTSLILTRDAALAGFNGGFNQVDAATISLAPEGSPALLQLVGGSMAAQGQAGTIRDQRGFVRSASKPIVVGLDHEGKPISGIDTPLTEPAGTKWLMRSAQSAVTLNTGHETWTFWFRDLPVDNAPAPQAQPFQREKTRSKAARGVNDPAAFAPAWTHLKGYEWRLGPAGATSPTTTDPRPLPLLGFNFYPLTLESAAFTADNRLQSIEVVGRLLFAWDPEPAERDRANAARLTFTANAAGVLTLTAVSAEDADLDPDAPAGAPAPAGLKGEWVLDPAQESTNPVRLLWNTLTLQGGTIVPGEAIVDFFFWGKRWQVPIQLAAAGQGFAGHAPITPVGVDPITATGVNLTIDTVKQANTLVSLDLTYRWGDTTKVFLSAKETRLLVPPVPTPPQAVSTFTDLSLAGPNGLVLPMTTGSGQSVEGSVQIDFKRTVAGIPDDVQLLAGMHLDTGDSIQGVATMTFAVNGLANPPVAGAPQPLVIQAGFAEILFRCEWGKSLQEPGSGPLSVEPFYDPCAGSISAGLACSFSDNRWTESLLLNGLLEVRSLVSWPLQGPELETNLTFQIPAVRGPGAQTPLHHARHTIRILFDQHEIDHDSLAPGLGNQIFSVNSEWDTLAVVEHQLVDVQLDPAKPASTLPVSITQDRRWTVLQPVQFSTPTSFALWLEQLQPETAIRPDVDRINADKFRACSALYGGDVLDPLPGEIRKLTTALIVEASGAGWIRQRATSSAYTAFEFLPGVTPGGILTSPADFTASADPKTPEWILTSVPFLGRLMPVTPALPALLAADPIVYLAEAKTGLAPINMLALRLSSRADANPVSIPLSSFDLAGLRAFDRLDPASVEESWFRVANPPVESQSDNLTSVLATLPGNGPGRLGRPAALNRVYDSRRYSLPPRIPPDTAAQISANATAVDAVFLIQGFAPAANGYTLFLAGALLLDSPFSLNRAAGPLYYPAAWLIPPAMENNSQPVTLAVSPYLGLKRFAMKSRGAIRIAWGELLGTQTTGALDVLARQLWSSSDGATPVDPTKFKAWALETIARVAPDSRAAILRVREVCDGTLTDGSPTATVDYNFQRLDLDPAQPLALVTHPLRTTLPRLRYAEGNYGGAIVPSSLSDFETAPPQVRDVQPVWLEHRPLGDDWPWGVSVLRMRVRYTESVGVLGSTGGDTLWWQSSSASVQFQTGEESERELPPLFRASAIQSLVPALPSPTLPVVSLSPDPRDPNLTTPPLPPDDNWQPLLPPTADVFFDGARPGAGFVLRSHLQRQFLKQETVPSVDVSGSIPVQHRMPRPVPLRPNLRTGRDAALRTWANYDSADMLLAAGQNPSGTAFIAPLAGDLANQPEQLRVTLISPPNGVIPPDWDGKVQLATSPAAVWKKAPTDPKQPPEPFAATTLTAPQWKITLQLETAKGSLKLDPPPPDPQPDPTLTNTWTADPSFLGGLAHGDAVVIAVTIENTDFVLSHNVRGYGQKLVFSLLVARTGSLALPLSPVYTIFEDPQYNRALVSQTSHAEGIWLEKNPPAQHRVLLALDRREYNPNSSFYAVYVFSDGNAPADMGPAGPTLNIQTIRKESGDPVDLASIPLSPGTLSPEMNLADLYQQRGVAPIAGDVLACTLRKADGTAVVTAQSDIVTDPVTPAPEAAYALLRKDRNGAVACVRFAWSPAATRIELLNPGDLLGETVRRRAVFAWLDSTRSPLDQQYGLQKLAANGSTHSIEDALWIRTAAAVAGKKTKG